MSNEQRQDEKNSQEQTGDPGRTPGAAEGDEETIDEDLRDKLGNAGEDRLISKRK